MVKKMDKPRFYIESVPECVNARMICMHLSGFMCRVSERQRMHVSMVIEA